MLDCQLLLYDLRVGPSGERQGGVRMSEVV